MKDGHKTPLTFIWEYIKKDKFKFLSIQILSLGWALDTTLWPYVFKLFIGKMTSYSGDKAFAWSYLARLSYYSFYFGS